MQPVQYALLTYKAYPQYNVGDYIQSLAAAQFLPGINKYINREKLSAYNDVPVKMILNGWFMHHPENWPPSNKISPLVISFHLNSQAKDKMLSPQGIGWFRKHAPVGCRDEYTLNLLQQADINAYLSGCLTTTLQNKWNYRTENIIFCDVLYRAFDSADINSPRSLLKSVISGSIIRGSHRLRLLRRIFSEELINQATFVRHYHNSTQSESERFDLAENLLEKYATAKLVITSRLHCALPCLAFGTPVIFVDQGFHREYDNCRMRGVTSLFNTINVDNQGNVSANFQLPSQKVSSSFTTNNPDTFRKFVPLLDKACRSFINEAQPV